MTNAPAGQQKVFRWPDLSAYGCYLNIYIEDGGKQVMSLSGDISNEIREKIETLGFVRLPAGLYALTRMYPEFPKHLAQKFPDMRMLSEGDVCADGAIMSRESAIRDLTKPEVRRVYGNPVRNIAPENDDLTMNVTTHQEQETQTPTQDSEPESPDDHVVTEEQPVAPRPSFTLPVVDSNGNPVIENGVELTHDVASLYAIENYLPDAPLYESADGVRYVQRKLFEADGQERPVLIKEDSRDLRQGWFLRAQSVEDMSSAAFRLVREMDKRPIMAEEFKRWVRAVYSIAPEGEIPQEEMSRALTIVSLEISKNVVRNASLRMRERYDLLCRLVQNMPVIASRSPVPTVTPQLAFAVSRAMALDTMPTEAVGMVLNDSTGLASVTANKSEGTRIAASCPEGMDAQCVDALKAFLKQTPADIGVSADPILERNALFQHIDMTRQASEDQAEVVVPINEHESRIIDMREDMVNALALLETRHPDGRSAILFASNQQSAQPFLELVQQQYHIEGVASIAPRVVGGKSNQSPLLSVVVGKRGESDSKKALDVAQITDNAELWSWTSSVIAERARFSGMSVEQAAERAAEEDNDFQAPYSPMSLVGDAESMVPVNQLGPITKLQCWVRERVADNGFHGPDSIDRFVFDKTGIDVTKGLVSAEQIDFAATALCVFEKSPKDGNAILNADGTGLGKTRENIMVANAAVLSGKFITYTTEHGAHFSDMYAELCALGIQDNMRILTLNDEPISSDPLTKEVLIPATPRHIVNGLTQRLHFPDGTPMSCYIVSGKERKRLDRMRVELEAKLKSGVDFSEEDRTTLNGLTSLESIRSKTQFTTIGEEDFMEMGGYLVDRNEIKAVHHEAPLYNFFLTTYSQINRPSVKRQMELMAAQRESGKATKKTIYRHDKTEFFISTLAKRGNNSLLILDESHNASDCSANTFHNVSEYVESAKWLIYASATWTKRVQNMQNYRRLLSRTITVESLSALMAKGDEVIHETFARMLAYESYMRRELSLANCKHQVYSSDKHLGKQIEIINTVNAVRNAIAALHSDIDLRLSWLNKMVDANRSINEVMIGLQRRTDREETRFSLSGSVAARRMVNDVVVSVLAMDDIADASIALLQDGVKPYIVVEGTHERFISDFNKKNGRIPTLHDVLRRSVTAATQVKSGRTTIDLSVDSGAFDVTDDLADAFVAALPAVFKPIVVTEDMDSDTRLALHKAREEEVRVYFEENGYKDFADARMTILTDVAEKYQQTCSSKAKKVFFEAYMNITNAIMYSGIDRIDLQVSFTSSVHDRIPRNPAKIARAIHKMIDLVPDMPISTLDFVKERIAQAGFVCGEITGRTECIQDGKIVRRADVEEIDKRAVVDSFNTRSTETHKTFDAVIGNGASASSLSMHNRVPSTEEEERTFDLRTRAHVSSGNLDDAAKAQQSFGRVYRKNGSGAVYCSVQNQTPAGIRAIARTRRKLRQSSALITSKRDSSFTAGEVLDIEDRVGDIVCFRYLHDKTDLAKELGLMGAIESNTKMVEVNNEQQLSSTCAISSQRVLQAIETLLPYEDQIKVIKELESEYHAHIEELDALGINPLRVQNLKGQCSITSKTLISGYEGSDRYQSAFTKPVYLAEIEQSNKIDPITIGSIISSCEAAQRALPETPRERADFLWAHRDSILAEYKTDSSVPVDHYIERRDNLIPSMALVNRYNRLVELIECLRCLRIGNEVVPSFGAGFYPDRGVITNLTMPQRSESPESANGYFISVVYPSQDKPDVLRISSMIHVIKTSLMVNDSDRQNYGVFPESGLNSDSPESWINSYNAIRDRRSRTLKQKRHILIGNELMAMSLAVDCQCGHVVTYETEGVDSSGEPKLITERAILVTDLQRLNNRAVSIETPELAVASLLYIGRIAFTTGGADALITIKNFDGEDDSDEQIRIKFPAYSSKTAALYDDPAFQQVIATILGDDGVNRMREMRGTRKLLTGLLPSKRAAVTLASYMMENGYACAVSKEHRDKIAELRQELYGDNGAEPVQPLVQPEPEPEQGAGNSVVVETPQPTSGLLEL